MIERRTQPCTPGVALAVLVLLAPGGAFALDPSLDLSQYAHTAWRGRDGSFRGAVTSIAQTPDGYLWLGTDLGLLRFDGVRTVPWPPAGERPPSNAIKALLVARDGTLWIGTPDGIASWKDGKLTRYPDVAADVPLVEDRDGTIWFGKPATICALRRGGKIECEKDPRLDRAVSAGYEDSSGVLWIGSNSGLWRWKPGPPQHYPPPPGTADVRAGVEDGSGGLLLGTTAGVRRLVDGKIESQPPPGFEAVKRPLVFLRSRDGSVWIGSTYGLWRRHQGRTEVFREIDGLSGQVVEALFEDREGTVWVGTLGGLDRFREYAFATVSVGEGLSSSLTFAAQATADGSIWISAAGGLNRWQDGHITIYGNQPGARTADGRTPPALTRSALGLDDRGRLWLGQSDGVWYRDGERPVLVGALPAGSVMAFASGGAGDMWVSMLDKGLFHWTGGDAAQRFSWESLGQTLSAGASAMLADRAQRGVWLGFRDGGVAFVNDGGLVKSWSGADGLGAGNVGHLRFGERGEIWAATETGLSRIAEGKIRTLTARQGLPCDVVHWTMEDDDHAVWVYMSCGLLRIARSELNGWVADPARKVQPTVFGTSDGVVEIGTDATLYTGFYAPAVTKAPDGKIWFAHRNGVTRIDPRHLPRNPLPPPVYVERITADGQVYAATAGLRLPPSVRDLGIDYTALSLVAPEKMRFRVKLEGQDSDWRELVNERRVHYTNLPPKRYRFRVKASNDSGVWNEQGAFLDFTIPPAWYETAWFRVLSVAVLGALLWGAYRTRVRFLERHQAEITALNDRLMKAQEEERARIAGELHDGIVQQITTTNLLLGTVIRRVPPDAKAIIEEAQEVLIGMGSDVRQLSHQLHPALLQEAGLPAALSSYCGEFSKTRSIPVSCEAEPSVNDLSPGAALALYRIAQEALGNAAKHAKATAIRVRLTRDANIVRLTVSDDGVGFAPNGAGISDGVGLVNMRERVRQLDGRLQVESERGRGTTVRAEVPFRPA